MRARRPGMIALLLLTGSISGQQLIDWETWWEYNKAPYLVLDRALPREPDEDRPLIRRPTEAEVFQKIAPAFLRALERERVDGITTSCLVGLAQIGEGGPVDPGAKSIADVIGAYLSAPRLEVSERAALALGILGDRRSIGILTHLALDTPEGRVAVSRGEPAEYVRGLTRAHATIALGLLADRLDPDDGARREILATLVSILRGGASPRTSPDLSVAAVTAMGLIALPSDPEWTVPEEGLAGNECLEAQIRFLFDAYHAGLGGALARAHCPTAIARLLRFGGDRHPGLIERSAASLIEGMDPESGAAEEVRQSCALALGMLGDCDEDPIDRDIRRALIDLGTSDAEITTRGFALIALAQVSGRAGGGKGDPLAGAPLARRVFIGSLPWGGYRIRMWTGLAIGVMERSIIQADPGGAHSSPAILELRRALLECRTIGEIAAFTMGLGLARDLASGERARYWLEEIDDRFGTWGCAWGLGLMGDPEATLAIREVIRSSRYRPDPMVAAATAARLLDDGASARLLSEMLAEASGVASRASISMAMGHLGDASSIDPLIALLEDEEATGISRGIAADALALLASGDPPAWRTRLSEGCNFQAFPPVLAGAYPGVLEIGIIR